MNAYMRVIGLVTLFVAPALFGKMVGVYNNSDFVMDVEIAFCEHSNRSDCGDPQKFRLAPWSFNAMEIKEYRYVNRTRGFSRSVDYCVSSIKATVPTAETAEAIIKDGKVVGVKKQVKVKGASITRDVHGFCTSGKSSGNPLYVITATQIRINKILQPNNLAIYKAIQ